MEKQKIIFSSAKEMVNWLIDNENVELFDFYGRKWYYNYFSFYYADINEEYKCDVLDCLHLYGEGFYYLIENTTLNETYK